MAIAFKTIAFPEHLMSVESGSFRLVPAHKSAGSIFSGFVSAYGLIEQRWVADCRFAEAVQDDWQEFEAFIATLEGQVVLFTCHDPLHELPRGAGAGHSATVTGDAISITGASLADGATLITGATSVQVKTAATRYARSVVMKGLAASATVFKPGDFFELGRNLYMVTGDVTSDSSGDARVPFRPRLRLPAAADDIVNLRRPKARFQLVSPDQGTVQRRAPALGTAALRMIEVPFV